MNLRYRPLVIASLLTLLTPGVMLADVTPTPTPSATPETSATPCMPNLALALFGTGQDYVTLTLPQQTVCVVASYALYRATASGANQQTFSISGAAGSYTDNIGVTAGTSYVYYLMADGSRGDNLYVTTPIAPTPTPAPTPSATPVPATPSATPMPTASVSPTPTATYQSTNGAGLLASATPEASATPTPTATAATPAQKVLQGLIAAGLAFLALGAGLLVFWKRRTAKGTAASKVLTPELEPEEPIDKTEK